MNLNVTSDKLNSYLAITLTFLQFFVIYLVWFEALGKQAHAVWSFWCSLKLGDNVHIYISSSINFTINLRCLRWVISWRSITWLTSRNVGAHCCVCPSRPRLHQSHLATALGLPLCNFMAQKYNVSFCQHSLLMEACSFAVVSSMHPAIFFFFFWYCENVAQHIYSILILHNFKSFMLVTKRDFKAKKKDVFWEIRSRLMAAMKHFLASFEAQQWWSTILWQLMLL